MRKPDRKICIAVVSVVMLMFSSCTKQADTTELTGKVAVSETPVTQISMSTAESIVTPESETGMQKYDFSIFTNVEIIGVDLSLLSDEEVSVLYRQAEYCQAMCDADIYKMKEIVSEDMVFTHMSGKQQSREEYFADIAEGKLVYYSIGIEDPVISINDGIAEITYTSVLDANAYGAKGVYHIKGTHRYELHNGSWVAVNR